MKGNIRVFIFWFLLFVWWNFTLAQNLTVDKFNSIWNNGIDHACYSGNSVAACDPGNPVRGCVKDARQSTWSFENEWDVEIRKLVWPTSTPWIFDVHILLRWKRVPQVRNDLDVCSVVVFDKSWSMKNGYNSGSATKRDDAVSWAVSFSNILINWNVNSKVWLVFFSYTGSIARDLDHETLGSELFNFTPVWDTNIHDWLVKAGDMLDSATCDAKYIILMSDWVANRYWPDWSTGSSVASSSAKNFASELKSQWIVIYSIWYDVNSSARGVLMNIAQDSGHYSDASGANISQIFQDIWNVTVELNAWTPSDINDEIWWAMLRMWEEIQIVEGAQIIDPGTVYSFQIKIKTGVVWFQPSNNGLTLTYKDVTWDNQTLSIAPENSAQIYWTAPKCEWTYPSGTSIKTWADTFIQDWDWDVLKPESKEWLYTPNSNPWECEWTCNNANYGWNTRTNTCEIKVNVSFDPNGWTWNIPSQTIVSWMDAVEPTVQPTRTWYQFSWWNLSGEKFIFPWTVTWDITLKAIRDPNEYEIKFNWNWSTSWTMWNQKLFYDETWYLNDNKFTKEWYHFVWWNTKPDWTWTWYINEAEVRNLAVSWEVNLYAQREPNTYTIIFDWNGSTAWTMTWLKVIYDQEQKLTKNDYSKNWNKFIWWNTSPDGKWVSYTDEQIIKNLATSWEIKLFAQWQSNWGSSGWWWKKKDVCSDGDYSWDYYDWKCNPPDSWKVEPEPERKPNPDPLPLIPNKKCSIEWSEHSAEVNEAYVWACERWIIKSNTIQGAKLWEFLNRAEMAKITTIFEMLEVGSIPNRNKDCSAFAESMSGYNQEMKDYMVTSCQLLRMWIHTADYTPIKDFMPKKFVSRAEFWTILSRILWWDKYEASKNSVYYYVDHLNKLKDNWILTNINPNLVERRSYAILMIYRAAKMMGKI